MTVNGVFYIYCYQPLLYLLELQHTSDHFSIHGLGVCLRYPYADRIVVALFGIEIQFVAAVAFCHIRYVEASDAEFAVVVNVEEVEDMLDVFDAVDMTVHVNVAVIRVDCPCLSLYTVLSHRL